MKKILSFFVSLLMCFSVLAPVSAQQNTKGFIDEVSVKDVNDGQIGVDSHVKVNFKWSLKDYKKGDVIKVSLPKQLSVPKELDFILKTDTNEELGKVHVGLDNVVTITLSDPNNYIATHENIHGTLEFSATLNEKNVNIGNNHLEFVENNGAISSTDINVTASPDAPTKDQHISKWGIVYDEKGMIDWKVRVNFAQDKLENAYVLENLGGGQVLLPNSIKIYEVTYKGNSDEILTKVDVTNKFAISNVTGSSFKVNFGNIEKSYMIEFSTKITDMSQIKYLNTATIKASGLEESDHAKEELFTGSGSAVGENLYSLRISKRDGDTLEPLAGVTFNLTDAKGHIVYDNLVTDVDGVVNVGGLSQGTYYLRELKTNDGYELLVDPIRIVIDENSPKQINVVVDNFKKKLGNVELTKTDDAGAPLKGVQFALFDLDNNKVVKTNLLTDANGKIYVKDLKPGHYAFKETRGLPGYKYSSQLHRFTISSTNLGQTVKVKVVNCRMKTDVCFNKIDNYGFHVKGAVLGLYDENNRLITTWTSGSNTVKLKDLIVGKQYTIKELRVPYGYKKANDITFRVNTQGQLEIKSGYHWVKQGRKVINMVDARKTPCNHPVIKPGFGHITVIITEIIIIHRG